ncbi:MAG: AraC family transcriptional regulator [Lachnospiraceae bacterium]|nr:AraC family transcriptional regulator [Lachnospiraceae bacterium]
MIYENCLQFEKKHIVSITNQKYGALYLFDYDERNASINMEFEHQHSYYEIMVFLAPAGEHLFEGQIYHLSFGDIVLIPPFLLHKSIYRKGAPSDRIIIDFIWPETLKADDLGYAELLSMFEFPEYIFRFAPEQRVALYRRLNDILNYSLRPGFSVDAPLDQLMIHTLFVEFLHELYTQRNRNQYRNNMEIAPAAQKMHSVAAYIHQHYSEPLSLQSLAEKFYISPGYLSHSFRETMQFTLSSYIQNTRFKNAQHMLITTNAKISDIAIACGFSSFSQFNRIFGRMAGMSPSEYRKQAQNTHKL